MSLEKLMAAKEKKFLRIFCWIFLWCHLRKALGLKRIFNVATMKISRANLHPIESRLYPMPSNQKNWVTQENSLTSNWFNFSLTTKNHLYLAKYKNPWTARWKIIFLHTLHSEIFYLNSTINFNRHLNRKKSS